MANNQTNPNENWYDNNPFFENKLGYDEFTEAMMMSADARELPLALQLDQPETLTMKDIKLFSQRFKQDTCLDIEFNLTTCKHCDQLHCVIIVDEYREDDKEGVADDQFSKSPCADT